MATIRQLLDNPGSADIRPGEATQHLDAALREFMIGYQPIVDVARGIVAGYQAQPLVPTADRPRPLDIDAPSLLSADTTGTLTAAVARRALSAVSTLPANTFLTIPVGVHVAATDAVERALLADGRLDGIVLDVVGPSSSNTPDGLTAALDRYRAAGVKIAVGGRGDAQPELTSIVRLTPSILRLGRDWVRGIDESPAKQSAVEVIGQLAGRLDAWILAEGVCTAAELQTLAGLQVPLAQGPFIGASREEWPQLELDARTVLPRIRNLAAERPDVATARPLRQLVQHAYTATDAAAAAAVLPETAGFDVVVILDGYDRPVTLLEQRDATWAAHPVLTINVETPVADAVQRALARPRSVRFTPLACTDDRGRFLGILRMERLMSHLARGSDGSMSPR